MKILIVDDEPVARQRIERALLQLSEAHQIRQAGNAKEALAAIGVEVPDVVLLDIEMPGVDGLTLASLPTCPPSCSSPRTPTAPSKPSRQASSTTW